MVMLRVISLRVLFLLCATFAAPRMFAGLVTYTDQSFTLAATLGSTNLTCAADPLCVIVTITFVADTANIQPYSVAGASGFENFVGHGSVELIDLDTSQTLDANFVDGQIYVSVDQPHNGVGFGSTAGGPTYPLATYAATPSVASYDLTSDISLTGFSWFCPPPTPTVGGCFLGQPGPTLLTDHGALSITPYGPDASFFSATVAPSPEPSPMVVLAAGLSVLILRLRSKSGSRALR